MKWVAAAGFDFSNMAPGEMALSRHVEYLRADAKLVALFGGSTGDATKIKCVPFGSGLELGTPPMLIASVPAMDRQPAPGAFIETVTVRDIIRFHSEVPTGAEVLWEPGILTVLSHLIGVVKAHGQLTYTTISAGDVQLARRVDMREIGVEPVESPQTGPGQNLFDLHVDWQYSLVVRTGDPRLWPLVTVGA